MLLNNLLENSAAKFPEKTAIVYGPDRITYGQLDSQANIIAAFLQTAGITKGDRIALLLENCLEYVISYYAVLKIGAVAVPLNPGFKPDGLLTLFSDLEPAAIITSYKSERLLKAIPLEPYKLKSLLILSPKLKWNEYAGHVISFEECLSDNGPHPVGTNNVEPKDLASIVYTSGSTGKPKGVMLSHSNIVSNTNSICQYLNISSTDIQMVVLPFFYVMGKSLLNTHIAAGGTIVINNGFMYPADVVNQMISENVTSFSGVPSTYAYLLNRSPLPKVKNQLKSLRYCSQAGGHMARSLKVALRKVLPVHTDIIIMYGASEAAARLTYLPAEHFSIKIESIGKPIPEVSVRIVDEQDHKDVPIGQQGVLVANGPNIMMGYWKNPQDTNRVLSSIGYHTGDIGFMDGEGFIYVTGRHDGLLKVSGHRVNPVEIEDIIMATDMAIETAVIGLPDELQGNKLVALIVLKDGSQDMTQEMIEMRSKIASSLPRHKVPGQMVPVRSLPKNANGKVDMKKCQDVAAKMLNK